MRSLTKEDVEKRVAAGSDRYEISKGRPRSSTAAADSVGDESRTRDGPDGRNPSRVRRTLIPGGGVDGRSRRRGRISCFRHDPFLKHWLE